MENTSYKKTVNMSGANDYRGNLQITNPLTEPIMRDAIAALHLNPGSHGLDAGCGIGLQSTLLAEAIGSNGSVVGLDISDEFLANAEEMVNKSPFSRQISFQQGDVHRIPFANNTFDWAWSASSIGYAPFNPIQPLNEIIRVVKPGGIVALLAWSSETLLPGYPLLEARLKATTAGIAPFTKGKSPELNFSCALGWFRQTGMELLRAQTFVSTTYAPLSKETVKALTALIQMRWPGVESELSVDDAEEYQRLCRPESPDFILNHPDYYAFFTCSMFWGSVVAKSRSKTKP